MWEEVDDMQTLLHNHPPSLSPHPPHAPLPPSLSPHPPHASLPPSLSHILHIHPSHPTSSTCIPPTLLPHILHLHPFYPPTSPVPLLPLPSSYTLHTHPSHPHNVFSRCSAHRRASLFSTSSTSSPIMASSSRRSISVFRESGR